MSVAELLAALDAQGVELWFEGDRLHFRARKGALAAEQRAALAAQKPAILAHLRAEAARSEKTCPLSYSQQSLWFLYQQAPKSVAYNVALSARVLSPLDDAALAQAVQALVDRYASLRTTYKFDGAAPLQRVTGAAHAEFVVHDASDAGDAALRAAVEADYRRPFDLEHGPVLRVSLYRRRPDEHVLLVALHHIAADGWSLLLLVEELLKLHHEATGGPPAGLARPTHDYTDYVAWQETMLAGPEGERLWSYWREKLAPPRGRMELPTDRAAPKVNAFRGASLGLAIEPALTQSLKRHAVSMGTTPFVLFLASFQALLFRLTCAEDIVVGTPTFGRSKADFMRITGDFINSVPLRGKLSAGMAFRDLVVQLKATVHEALDAGELPLPLMVNRLHPDRDSSRSPLFDTFFALQRFDQFKNVAELFAGSETDPPVEACGLRLAPYPISQQEGQFDLSLWMTERGGVVYGAFKYSTDLFDEATIRGLARDYVALLEAVDRQPDAPLGDIPEPALRGKAADRVDVLLEALRARDIHLVVDNGKLRVNAPKGALSDEVKATIAARRDAIMDHLRSAGAQKVHEAVDGIPRAERRAPLPVSSAQQRLWFLDRMEPERPYYNIGGSVRLRGPLDAALVERAVEHLVRRHESLRTTLGERDGAPDVQIHETARVPFDLADFSHLPVAEAEAKFRRRSEEVFATPLSVARGPLARVLLVRIAAGDQALVVCVHHIVADGWSMMILFREIFEIYEALAADRAPHLPALPVQYVDYSAWERDQLLSNRIAAQIAYWKEALAGAPAVLELPTDRPRPAAQSFRGGRIRRNLDARLLEDLKQLSRKRGCTLYMTLLAAFQVLLHRYSGQEDIVVGSPIANREQPAFEGVVGCFVNNIVLRTHMGPAEPFAELLGRVKQTFLAAFEHREVPFDVLVDALRPGRSTNHAPVFQVMFALQSFLTPIAPPSGMKLEIVEPIEFEFARFDLSLELVEHEGELMALYEYSSDLFDRDTIARMHAHFEELLRAIVRRPEARIEDLPLLSGEDERLLGAWNETSAEHDRTRCLHQLVEAQARATPGAIAAASGGETLTYGALEERANRLAHALTRRGVTPGSLVGVCLDRTVDVPVVLAAVLKAGAAYVPLDPAHPADRIRYTLEDAGVACTVTLGRLAGLFAASRVPLVPIDELGAELATMPAGPPPIVVRPEDRAYVIYTSGSTGRPKGVEVEHRNVVSFLEAMRREPGLHREDRILAVTTLSFDIAGLELWLPLSSGACVTIASRADVIDGERLIAMLAEERITVLQATPATFRLLLEAGWSGKPDLRVLVGGEALPRDLAALLVARVKELWNVYGPTETTIWSTVSRIDDPSAPITIGRPIRNTRIYVLERGGQPAPIGVPGELCIAGEGVARGYHDRPELTAEKFVTLALPGGRTERAYRTGDVARFRADGCIDFLGRRDHQVKVRGYRIELGEIEAVLATHPGVKECVVGVREDSPGDHRLVGYVVMTEGAVAEPEALRATLRAKLPEYMVPNAFVALAALPLTPNGKIDRKGLPVPQASPVPVEDGIESLMTPVQRRVASSWRQVLRVDRVGLYENFFDIGGHSLLLVKLHAALKKEFESDIALVELFQWTTVAAQAGRLSAAAPSDGAVHRARARAARLNDG
jgi:amino acid adenylation domain-containing protein